MRPAGLPTGNVVLFYSNRKRAAASLPWVAALCGALEMPLTAYTAKKADGEVSQPDESREFLDHHGILAEPGDRNALEVIEAEADEPGTVLPSQSLLVFDRGYRSRLWFRKRARLVTKMIRSSAHTILLCS